MSDVATYVVAGCRPWNRELFERRLNQLDGEWVFVDDRDALTSELLDTLSPRFVFFLHWNWIVPSTITETHECVVFHMTDVPYGRGGSPLQNLMVRGHDRTVVSALRMAAEVDAGPVYAKVPLELTGSAEEIYRRAGECSADIIEQMVADPPTPVEQHGDVTTFSRRTPDQSVLPTTGTVAEIDRFVRMLDADGYPRAFVEHGDLRLVLSDARLVDGRLTAHVEIHPSEQAGS